MLLGCYAVEREPEQRNFQSTIGCRFTGGVVGGRMWRGRSFQTGPARIGFAGLVARRPAAVGRASRIAGGLHPAGLLEGGL